MNKILILFAHPAFQKSKVNRELVNSLHTIEGVTFFDLYEQYPEMDIDVHEQQQLLLENDIIIFQHPFFWYSTPAILKEWQDLVLEHGWAYGSGGTHLKGKVLLNTITTGGSSSAYTPDGFHGVTMRQLLLPLEKTAKLCRMIYLAPYVIHGSLLMDNESISKQKNSYIEMLKNLRDEKINMDIAKDLNYLNDYKNGK